MLGGGFAGVSAARELQRRCESDEGEAQFDVVLVNRENYFVFQPLLSDALTGSIDMAHAVIPLRRMLPGVDVEVGVVDRVDTATRAVHLHRRLDPDATVEIGYDALIVALGSTTDFSRVPGMAEHAIGLRTLGDTFFLRNRALTMLEEADLEPSDEVRRRLLTFVVIGGGSTGVEVAAALEDLLGLALRSFRSARHPLVPRVVLVHSRDRVLPEYGTRLGRYVTRRLRDRHVKLRLGARVARVTADGVELDDGEGIEAATVVSTVGNAPHPLLRKMPGRHDERGWLAPDERLSLPGTDGVWAAGDCASIIDTRHGGTVPATAQFAVREGPVAARNALAWLQGRAQETFHYDERGMLVSLGRRSAAGRVLGQNISGLPAWAMWRGYYLAQLPTWDRRIRVGLDWLLELFLPRDVVQLDVRRTPPLHHEAVEEPDHLVLSR